MKEYISPQFNVKLISQDDILLGSDVYIDTDALFKEQD